MPSQFEQFRAELDGSPVHGRSPLGYVEVTRDEHGDITVTIEPGTFRELTHNQLTAEVRAALAAAVSDYSNTSNRLFQRWGGSL
jgi:DNA-binding protein YbaB